jgi:hypothetical protein
MSPFAVTPIGIHPPGGGSGDDTSEPALGLIVPVVWANPMLAVTPSWHITAKQIRA